MLNQALKDLLSQYADDALDLGTTRKVADLVASSPEAEKYFTRLQRLRRAADKTLGKLPEEDRAFNVRVLAALRRQSSQPTPWERMAERWMLAPRYALAASIVLIILILALFSRFEPQLSSFFSRAERTVVVLEEEARKGLHSLTRSAGLAEHEQETSASPQPPPTSSSEESTDDKTGVKVQDEWRVAGSPGGML